MWVSPAKRHPVRFGVTLALAQVAVWLVVGGPVRGLIGILIWIPAAIVGVRRFPGRFGEWWPLIIAAIVAVPVLLWRALS